MSDTAILKAKGWSSKAERQCYANQSVRLITPMVTDVKGQVLVELVSGSLTGSRIWVTADDLAEGQAWPCEATECPVARESPRTSGKRPERTKANGQEAGA